MVAVRITRTEGRDKRLSTDAEWDDCLCEIGELEGGGTQVQRDNDIVSDQVVVCTAGDVLERVTEDVVGLI
jgi:hypothetical protein